MLVVDLGRQKPPINRLRLDYEVEINRLQNSLVVRALVLTWVTSASHQDSMALPLSLPLVLLMSKRSKTPFIHSFINPSWCVTRNDLRRRLWWCKSYVETGMTVVLLEFRENLLKIWPMGGGVLSWDPYPLLGYAPAPTHRSVTTWWTGP